MGIGSMIVAVIFVGVLCAVLMVIMDE